MNRRSSQMKNKKTIELGVNKFPLIVRKNRSKIIANHLIKSRGKANQNKDKNSWVLHEYEGPDILPWETYNYD